MASPDPKYSKNKKQKKMYLENFEKRPRMVIREEDEKYPDVKGVVSYMDIIKILNKLLKEKT